MANIFIRYFIPREFDDVIGKFDEGLVVEIGSDTPSSGYPKQIAEMGNLADIIRRIEPSDKPAAIASAVEFVLEGLHLNRRLNKDDVDGHFRYRK